MLALLVSLPAGAKEPQHYEVTVNRHVFRCKTDGEVFTDCSVQPPKGGTQSAFDRVFQEPFIIQGNLNFQKRYDILLDDLNAGVRQAVQAAMREKARPAGSTLESDSEIVRKQHAAEAQLKKLEAALADMHGMNQRLQARVEDLRKQIQERGHQDQHWIWSWPRALVNESPVYLVSMIVGGMGIIAGGLALRFAIRARKRSTRQPEEKRDEPKDVTEDAPPAGTNEPAPTFGLSEGEPRIDYTKLAQSVADKAALIAVTRLVEQLTPKLEEIRSTAEQRLDQIHETLKKNAPKATDTIPPTSTASSPSARGITPAKSGASPNLVTRGRSTSGPQDILKAWQSVEQRDAITPMDQTTYVSELIAELDLRETDIMREGPLFRIRRQDAAITSFIILDDGAFCGILTSADPEWYLLFARSQLCRRGDDYRVKFAKLFAWPDGWDGERPIRTVQPARGRRSAIDARAQMARLSVTAVEDFEIVPGTVEVT
ncbi:MAG TPA: hypothetical protein VGF28_13225 [Thermoanaerobaculia bacterium]|jgi:hypothetical protein